MSREIVLYREDAGVVVAVFHQPQLHLKNKYIPIELPHYTPDSFLTH